MIEDPQMDIVAGLHATFVVRMGTMLETVLQQVEEDQVSNLVVCVMEDEAAEEVAEVEEEEGDVEEVVVEEAEVTEISVVAASTAAAIIMLLLVLAKLKVEEVERVPAATAS